MIISPDTFRAKDSPLFIVFEGVNGAGKSTLVRAVKNRYEELKRSVTLTFEPGDSELGAEVRKLLFSPSTKPRQPLAELFLFLADRAQHVTEIIEPALKAGSTVLCDRYFYSTLAFQGYADGLDLKLLNDLNQIAIQKRVPDLVILLDLPADVGLARSKVRAATGDEFEKKPLDYHVRVRDGFLDLAKNRPEPFLVLDATKSAQELVAITLKTLGI